MDVTGQTLSLVALERKFQNTKWGEDRTIEPNGFINLAVLAEEVGEVSEALLDGSEQEIIEELVQVCAYSFAWIEAILKDNPEKFMRTIHKIEKCINLENTNQCGSITEVLMPEHHGFQPG